MTFLPYDPGQLPTRASPLPGDSITILGSGLPPYKDINQSIRNASHPRHASFCQLRKAASEAMGGQAWYLGPISLSLTIYAQILDPGKTASDYLGGVLDTLDGSHGFTFTYLPVVYEDDRQAAVLEVQVVPSPDARYELRVTFLPHQA